MMSFNDDLSTSLNQTFCEINGKLIDNDKNITQLIDNEVSCSIRLYIMFSQFTW